MFGRKKQTDPGPLAARADALVATAEQHLGQNEFAQAEPLLVQAAELYVELRADPGTWPGRGRAYLLLFELFRDTGRDTDAMLLARRSAGVMEERYALAPDPGLAGLLVEALLNTVVSELAAGELEGAIGSANRAVQVARAHHDPAALESVAVLLMALRSLALAYSKARSAADALQLCEPLTREFARFTEQRPDPGVFLDLARMQNLRGSARAGTGDVEGAAADFSASATIGLELAMRVGSSHAQAIAEASMRDLNRLEELAPGICARYPIGGVPRG